MPRRFAASVAAIIGAFLILEIIYAYRLPRVMDEFTGAHYIYLTSKLVPYRDFHPPKTVLAYYIQLPALAVSRGHWAQMTAMKIELAILWAAVLAAAAFTLRGEIDSRAVLGALAMTVVMSTFIERATEIRPDAIAAIFGLASLLALIGRRPALAGFFCAASFCSTQKGIYFALAGGLALVATAIRDRTRQSLVDVVRYGIVSTVSVVLYFLFWIMMSSPDRVFHRVIFDKDIKAAALTEMYAGMREHFWTQTLVRNPVFYAVGFIGLLILIPRWAKRTLKVDVIVPYTIVQTALCLWHKQPWPYFFVFLVPTLFVVIAVVLAELPWNRTFAIIAVTAAILIPLTRLPITLTRTVTAHQKAMVDTGEQLLAPGETYLDGTNMLFRHDQASSEFNWIDATTLGAFSRLSEAEVMTMIQHADAGRPKLVIWNYRIAGLPEPIGIYIDRRFLPLYGNLLFYAPAIRVPSFYVAFDGEYAINTPAIIDGAAVRNTVMLKRGSHMLSGVTSARLKLLPPPGLKADPEFAKPRDLFPDIYNY
jgi:hypothetical protein